MSLNWRVENKMFSISRKNIWADIKGIGELTVEELLVVANEPILFSCRKEESWERYLVMTYDSDDFQYVIAPIYPHILADMLDNKIPMEQAFREYGKVYYTEIQKGSIVAKCYDSICFNAGLLPEKGVFFDLKLNYIDRYIGLLKKEPDIIFDYDIYQDVDIKTILKEQICSYDYSCRFNPTATDNNYYNDFYKIMDDTDNTVEDYVEIDMSRAA